MPLDTLVTGRIATLAGPTGFGWVEAIGVRDGRIAFAGSEVDLETRADPHTRRITLDPDVVAIPGLTDAHLHLVQAAAARRQVDLSGAMTLEAGMAAVAAADERLAPERDAWIEGHGWDPDRWGRWPTQDDLERAAPGRRAALWAHDHHSLLASRSALATAAVTADTPDPAGGAIRREPDGIPSRGAPRDRSPSRDRPRAGAGSGGPRGRPGHGRARARPSRRRGLPRSRWRGARPRS